MAREKEAATKKFGAGRRKVCGRTTRSLSRPQRSTNARIRKDKTGQRRVCEDGNKRRDADWRFASCIWSRRFSAFPRVLSPNIAGSAGFRLALRPSPPGLRDIGLEAALADRLTRAGHQVLI